MPFFDTNVLLYSISTNPAELAKRERAITLLNGEDVAISVQVRQEFYVQATRPTKAHPLSHADAVDRITGWSRFRVQELTVFILNAALDIRARHRFSYWDRAIIAAASALGCRELYTEDISHGRQVEGVLIVNPFRSSRDTAKWGKDGRICVGPAGAALRGPAAAAGRRPLRR